ncbi:MAG: ABC transporter ATP-binding protein, partial [Gaiellaceae bacterium]
GIAGESGSGKAMSVLALMVLLPQGAAVEGQALFEGQDLLRLPPSKLRRICGHELAMVFQDPMTSLHPMLSIGTQLTEHVRLHLGLGRRAAAELAVEALHQVRIPDPESALHAFPHQFSGGMRQRIAIAVALACRPKLLIADEPTTALDVTVQAGIIRLLDRLRNESGLTIVLITHDLGVLSSIADRVSVFYAGRVVEAGTRIDVLGHPRHPYTRGLLDALPHPEATATPLIAIQGAPPTPRRIPRGCAFHPRCRYAQASCREAIPPLVPVNGRALACPVDPLRVGVPG